jgi:hypothetical protein
MDATNPMKLTNDLFDSAKNLILSVGLPNDKSWEIEASNNLLLEKQIEGGKLQSLQIDFINRAASAWGEAFECDFSGNGIREFSCRGASPPDETVFKQFQEDVKAAGPAAIVNVRIQFDKERFAQKNFQQESGVRYVIYVFASAFMWAYSRPFPEIEEIFLPQATAYCICLILEMETCLLGPRLAALGPSAFQKFDLASRPPRDEGREVSARKVRSDSDTWINFDTSLTPYHLFLKPSTDSPQELRNLAARKLYDLTLIYIADSVRYEANVGYEATFSGIPQVRVFAPLSNAAAVLQNATVLFDLFAWAFVTEGTDKPAVLRAVIASVLTADRIANYSALDQAADRVSQSTRASYTSLVRGAVTRHFDKLKDVDKYVQETGFQLGSQISGLASNLTANMLGTVGVTVGAFISFVIDKKATPKLLAFGSLLYGTYLLCFPLFYSLLLQNFVQYVITVREFRKRIHQFAASLNLPDLSKQYEPMIKSRRLHFWTILGISCVVYLLLITGSFFLYKYFQSMPTPP